MAGKISGSSETFIKLGLVFFISLLSFAIGTLVGKEYSDRQYKLSKMEPTENHGNTQREVASSGEHGVNKLSDEEIAKLSEEFMTDDTVEAAKDAHGGKAAVPAIEGHGSAAHGTTTAAKTPAEFEEMNDDALEAAQALIDGRNDHSEGRKIATTDSKAAVDKKALPATASKTAAALPHTMPKNAAQENVGKFTVQVGAFAKEDEAKIRAERLKAKGYNAFYIPGVVAGKTWYRVNVGTYATLEEAKRANEKYTADNAGQKGFIKEIH